MKEFLFNYGWILILLGGGVVYFAKTKKNYGKQVMIAELRELAYKSMLAAEKKYGSNEEGTFKFSKVVNNIYDKMPRSFKEIFSQDYICRIVQEEYNKTKDYLDDGEINNSIK